MFLLTRGDKQRAGGVPLEAGGRLVVRVAVPARVVRVVGRVVVVLTVHGRAHGDVATHRDNHSLNTIVINRGKCLQHGEGASRGLLRILRKLPQI